MTKTVLPTNDLAFKKLFSNQAHPEVVQGFLADVLDLVVDPASLRFANPYSIESYEEQQRLAAYEMAASKYSVFDNTGDDNARDDDISDIHFRETIRDVTIAIIDAPDVTIEMQIEKPENFLERAHYYIDDLYRNNYNHNIKTGENKYSSLKPVISLNITLFNIFNDNRALRTFTYRDNETFSLLTPALKRIGFLELSKSAPAGSNLAYWMEFFLTGIANPAAPSYVKEAAKIIQYHNLHQKERAMIDATTKAEDTSIAIMQYAKRISREAGHAEGMAEGLVKGKVEIARYMLQDGLPVETVAKFTKLDISEIKTIWQTILGTSAASTS